MLALSRRFKSADGIKPGNRIPKCRNRLTVYIGCREPLVINLWEIIPNREY